MSKHKMIGLGLALVALIILSLFPAPSMTAAASSGPEWLLADLHVHSKKSDGSLPPDKIVELYKEKGFDILAISDHDRLTQVKADGLIIIPALEWTCPGYLKHLLMYFVQRMPTSVTDAYNQGAFICIAHPATWSWGESTDIPKDIPQEVEGYELYNGHGLSAPSWCAEKWKGMVAGSDAHEVNKYCSVKVWVYAERNLASIEKALRQGNVCVGKKPNEPPKPPSFIHDVAVTKFRATSSTATIGQRAKLVVTIENEGGYQETLNLSIFDNTVNNRLISSQRFTLAPSKSRSQLIYWTPTEPAGIRHKLTAKVSVVRGETDVADNSLTISVLVFRK